MSTPQRPLRPCLRLLMFIALSLCASRSAHAATDTLGWTRSGLVSANLSQVQLTNWSGGGNNTVAINTLFGYIASYKTEHTLWKTTLDVGYGLTKLGKQEFRKSDDKLNFLTRYQHVATSTLNYSALFELRTQLTEGLSYDDGGKPTERTSNFFAPANLLLGLGATYTPAHSLSITLSPVSNRVLIVADDSLNRRGAFGVDSGKTVKSELGTLLNVGFKDEVFTNVVIDSKLSAFGAYAALDRQLVNWNTLVTMKVNSLLMVTLALDVIYDPNASILRDDGTRGPVAQIRDIVGIGFGFKF
ncbi:MAG: DUF3078 domain-containing protein [Candidatus Kapaibacterium sp.]